LEEMKVEPVDEKLRKYKLNWLHVTRLNSKRVPRRMLDYRSNGRRRLRITLKRILDEAEAGLSRPNS